LGEKGFLAGLSTFLGKKLGFDGASFAYLFFLFSSSSKSST